MHRVRSTTRTAEKRPGGLRGVRWFTAVLLLVPTFVVQAATTTSAGAAVVGNFEIEGNTVDDAVAGIDWESPGVPSKTSDPVGNADTTNFGEGAKEFEHPSTWVRKTGVAPNQDDISGVYFHDAVVDEDIWGFVGFTRYTTSGTTNFDVELNRLPNSTTNTFAPVRSVGDVLVRFEQDGNSTFKLTSGWFWTRVASADWDAQCTEVTGYSPRSGWCAESIANVPFTGATGDSGHFAEGAFNFSSLLEAGGIGGATCEGGDFGTMNIRSFTGNSIESALKDYVNPVTIDIDDSCGELEIYKRDQFGNLISGATFTISPNPIPGQTVAGSTLEVVEGGQNDPDGEADGDITFDPASPATYTVVETAAPSPDYELRPLAERTWTVTVGEGGVGSVNTPLNVENRRYFAPPTILNEPTYDVDREWQVSKAVVGDSTKHVPEGTTASFDYEVRLKALDPKPADFSDFDGKITLGNPNALDMVVTLAAGITGGAACTIDDAATLDVSDDAGVQVNLDNGPNVFTYACPAATLPGGTTATATWSQALYPQASGVTGPPVTDAKAFALDVETEAQTTVTDVFNSDSATTKTWGPFTWSTVRASKSPADHTITVATYSRTDVEGEAGTCTPYDNTARESADGTSQTQTVRVCVDLDDLIVSKTANPKFARDYDWTIEKSVTSESSQTVPEGTPATFDYEVVVTPSAPQDDVFLVTGVITVDNPNETTISGVALTDTLPGADCTINKPAGPLSIPSGKTTFAYSCELEDATATTKGTNTAKATWDAAKYGGTDGSATGTETFDFADAEPVVTDETATVTDNRIDLGEVPGGVVLEAADGVRTFTYTKELDGVPGQCTTYDNTAEVVEDDTYSSDTDTEQVDVCVEKPVVPTVSGQADLARAYAWSIGKVADATQRTVDGSGNATFTYTVTARAGAATDSGWRLEGSVTIANPNEYADGDITADVTAATTLGGGSVCTVTGGEDAAISEDSSVTLPIACTFGSQPASSGSLDVTATWDPAGEATTASVKASTPITFAVRSETNKTVQVVDDQTVAGQRVVLDPALTWASGLVKDYTYSLALKGGAPGSCQSWTNTATIDLPVGTDPTASAVVLACAPEVLPVQSFGKAVGSVKASCQGTVRAKLSNRSGETVTYKLRVGTKVHKIAVKSLTQKKFVTKGKARARVTLMVGSARLDKLRIPALCQAPEVLPDTGLRGTSN